MNFNRVGLDFIYLCKMKAFYVKTDVCTSVFLSLHSVNFL